MSVCLSACSNSDNTEHIHIWYSWLHRKEHARKTPCMTQTQIKLQIKRIKQKTDFRRIRTFPSSCPSVRLSASIDSHWTDSHGIWYWGLPRKSVEKIQICLKSDQNIGHVTWRPARVSCRRQRHTLRNNKQQLPRFRGNAVNTYYIAGGDICMSTIQREPTFSFP